MEIKQEPISFTEENQRQRSPTSSPTCEPTSSSQSRKRLHSNNLSERETSKKQKNDVSRQVVKKETKDPHAFENLLPKFDPSKKEHTISAWLNKVDRLADIYGWNEAEKIHFALEKLSGSAKTWYQSHGIASNKWSEWRSKLYEVFRENHAELLSHMLAIRVRGESLVNYYYEKMSLLSSCHIEGRDAVDCLVDGIDDDVVRMGAYAARLKTPEQVICYFQAVEVTHSHSSRQPKKLSTNKLKSKRHTCSNCGNEGHKTYRCFKSKNKCHICHKWGHLDVFCWERMDR